MYDVDLGLGRMDYRAIPEHGRKGSEGGAECLSAQVGPRLSMRRPLLASTEVSKAAVKQLGAWRALAPWQTSKMPQDQASCTIWASADKTIRPTIKCSAEDAAIVDRLDSVLCELPM